MDINFSKRFPELQSQKLRLRETSLEDAPFIHFLRSDTRVNEFVKRKRSTSLEDARFFIDQRHQDFFYKRAIYWCIDLNTTGFTVGTITLWKMDLENGEAEIGFEIHPDFQKRGIMSEALKMVTDFGFQQLQLDRIIAITSKDNKASLNLLKKFDFAPLEAAELSELDQENEMLGFVLERSMS